MSGRRANVTGQETRYTERGWQRLCRQMVRRIAEATATFPEEYPGAGYWCMALPVAQGFIDAPTTPYVVRQACMQTLIDQAQHLRSRRPAVDIPTRVVASITLPDLFDSQIIVFFGEEYFGTFFDRDSEWQRWTRLPDNRSISEEWSLVIPEGLTERGYHEEFKDGDYTHVGEYWFIGELYQQH